MFYGEFMEHPTQNCETRKSRTQTDQEKHQIDRNGEDNLPQDNQKIQVRFSLMAIAKNRIPPNKEKDWYQGLSLFFP